MLRRRWGVAAQFTVVSVVLVAGASAQVAVPQPSPPGTMVDIGGQALHVNCTGSGSPTVVLENGAGDYSFVWALVQPEVATHTRVCSYDRAGYAWSQPGRRPRTFAQLALELRTALSRLNEQAPFVLVGQSYGGVVVRGSPARYPKEVAGMVLVDATHEDQHSVWGGQPHLLRAEAKGRTFPNTAIEGVAWAKTDTAIAARSAPLPAPLDRLPPAAQLLWRWADSRGVTAAAQGAEMDWSPEELARMHTTRARDRASLGDLPLIVLARTTGGYQSGMSISADSLEVERRTNQQDLARLSRRGQLVYAPHSGHNIHIEDPGLVARSIARVVESVRRERDTRRKR